MIKFNQVTKSYPSGHTAIEELDLYIPAGQFVFVTGPSGSGKTTMLRLLLREILPTVGSIQVSGQDLSQIKGRHLPKFRRQIGAAFQDFKLIPDKSAYENVSLILEIIGVDDKQAKEKTEALFEQVGLTDKMHLYPSQLSGGEVQRVTIARAIAADPVVLFADEPTGNLDPTTSHQIIEILEKIHQAGTTIIMATHDMAVIDEYPHRKVELEKGKIVGDSDPAEHKQDLDEDEVDNQDEEEDSDSESKSELKDKPDQKSKTKSKTKKKSTKAKTKDEND